MGGWISYSCSTELKQDIPHLLAQQGIEVIWRPLPKGMPADDGFKFVCSRGSGRVEIGGTHSDEGDGILFVINPDHSFLCFWCKDMPLLKEIEETLLANGAVCNHPVTEDAQE